MEENNKVSVKINKIWIFIGILVVITIVANVYVMTNNKTQTSEDKNFETEEQTNAVRTRAEKIDETKTSESLNSTSNDIIKNNNEPKTYTYSNIKGLYKNTIKSKEEDIDINYELYLYENGTFDYQSYAMASNGVIGNYIIVDNNIILNYLFRTGSDAAIDATEGQKVLKIDEDGSITDSKPEMLNSTSLLLKKISDKTESGFDISYLINNTQIYNNTNIEREVDNDVPVQKKEIPESIYTKIRGIYEGTAKDSYDKNNDRQYWLYLHENGTFAYVNTVHADNGVTGNYIIIDDTIYLNYLFATGSDASLDVTEGKKELKINEDGSITDENPDETTENNLLLKKSSKNMKDEYNNINNMINNYCIYNKASNEE